MTKEQAPQPAPISLEQVTRAAKETTLRDGGHAPTLLVNGSQTPVIGHITSLASSHDEREGQMFTPERLWPATGAEGRLHELRDF